jgi:hypothetical protein
LVPREQEEQTRALPIVQSVTAAPQQECIIMNIPVDNSAMETTAAVSETADTQKIQPASNITSKKVFYLISRVLNLYCTKY